MYCIKCGREIEADANVCPYCGARVKRTGEEKVISENGGDTILDTEKLKSDMGGTGTEVSMKDRPGRQKFNRKFIAAAAAAVIIFIAVFGAICLVGGRTRTVDMNKYVSLTFEGYDGYGTAQLTFDSESFYNDYGDITIRKDALEKLPEEEKKSLELGAAFLGKDLENLPLYDFLGNDLGKYVSVTPAKELHNGDEVAVEWGDINYSADIENLFGVELKKEAYTAAVTDLEEAAVIDIFDGIEVKLDGVSGRGSVLSIENPNYPNISYTHSSASGDGSLSNDDVITIYVSHYNYGSSIVEFNTDEFYQRCSEAYGGIPSEPSMEYTVTGLGTYITSLDDVDQETIDQMVEQARNIYYVKEEGSNSDITSYEMEYYGSMLETCKVPGGTAGNWNGQYNNKYYVVMQMTYDGTDTIFGETYEGTTTAYWVVSYKNLTKGTDGRIHYDENDYNYTRNQEYYYMPGGRGSFSYPGYSLLEDLKKDCFNTADFANESSF